MARRDPTPTVQSLLAAPPSADLFTRLARRLRDLADAPESPRTWAEAEHALLHPNWGLRVLAIRAIGHWRSRHVKPWLRQRAERAVPPYPQVQRFPRGDPRRWEVLETQTARTAIRPLLTAEDAPWLLELWFADWLRTGSYDPIMATPADLAAHRLRAALNRPEEQEAALWLAFHHKGIPGRLDIMRHFAQADTPLGRSARNLLRIDAAPGKD